MQVGDRVKLSKAVIDRANPGRQYRASNARGTVTRIESNNTDTVAWVCWGSQGYSVTEIPSDIEVVTHQRTFSIS